MGSCKLKKVAPSRRRLIVYNFSKNFWNSLIEDSFTALQRKTIALSIVLRVWTDYRRWLSDRHRAVLMLQRTWRKWIAKTEYLRRAILRKRDLASTLIASAERRRRSRTFLKRLRRTRLAEERCKNENSVKLIQRVLRSRWASTKRPVSSIVEEVVNEEKVLLNQTIEETNIKNMLCVARNKAAQSIQSQYRIFSKMKDERKLLERLTFAQSAHTIQSAIRMFIALKVSRVKQQEKEKLAAAAVFQWFRTVRARIVLKEKTSENDVKLCCFEDEETSNAGDGITAEKHNPIHTVEPLPEDIEYETITPPSIDERFPFNSSNSDNTVVVESSRSSRKRDGSSFDTDIQKEEPLTLTTSSPYWKHYEYRFNRAAQIIQTIFRGYKQRSKKNIRSILTLEDKKCTRAAVVIQCLVRAQLSRQKVRVNTSD